MPFGPADFEADFSASRSGGVAQALGSSTLGRQLAKVMSDILSRYNYDTARNYVEFMVQGGYAGGGGFAPSVNTGAGAGTISFDNTTTLTGERSLRIRKGAAGDQLQAGGPLFRVKNSARYLVQATIFNELTGMGQYNLRVDWYDKNKVFVSASSFLFFMNTTSGAWQRPVFQLYVAPATACFARVVIQLDGSLGGAIGSAYIGEITFERETDNTPLGTIIAVDLNDTVAVNNTAANDPPDGYWKCNGSVVTDTTSPYFNLAMPNLNGAAAGAGLQSGQFLRGWTPTARNTVPTIQAQGTAVNGLGAQVTAHVHTMVGSSAFFQHHHPISTSGTAKTTPAFSSVAATLRTDASNEDGTTSVATAASWTGSTGNNTTNPFCTMTGDAETRPTNYPVVFFKRIR